MTPKDTYLKITDAEGNERVSEHRTWDEQLFIEQARKHHEREGNIVAKISLETYRALKKVAA